MPKRKHTTEEIFNKLRRAEVIIALVGTVAEAVRRIEGLYPPRLSGRRPDHSEPGQGFSRGGVWKYEAIRRRRLIAPPIKLTVAPARPAVTPP